MPLQSHVLYEGDILDYIGSDLVAVSAVLEARPVEKEQHGADAAGLDVGAFRRRGPDVEVKTVFGGVLGAHQSSTQVKVWLRARGSLLPTVQGALRLPEKEVKRAVSVPRCCRNSCVFSKRCYCPRREQQNCEGAPRLEIVSR